MSDRLRRGLDHAAGCLPLGNDAPEPVVRFIGDLPCHAVDDSFYPSIIEVFRAGDNHDQSSASAATRPPSDDTVPDAVAVIECRAPRLVTPSMESDDVFAVAPAVYVVDGVPRISTGQKIVETSETKRKLNRQIKR